VNGALVGLTLSAPLMLAVAVGVRFDMGRPIIFRQQRTGLNGRLFTVLKFRTMTQADGAESAATDAQRLGPFGRFLRHTSLDELPQFWNVLRGEMSLVGPRPLLPAYLPLYTPEQARRLLVRPGMTSWVAVNGRNAVSWQDQFAMDVWYVDNQSMLLDLKILVLTLQKVITREGVTQPGHASRASFRGSDESR
jgi:lipopolysaccharide/colanic/teichoic acid biosynthesis glycosyltransferase